jgi:hypothetical protein
MASGNTNTLWYVLWHSSQGYFNLWRLRIYIVTISACSLSIRQLFYGAGGLRSENRTRDFPIRSRVCSHSATTLDLTIDHFHEIYHHNCFLSPFNSYSILHCIDMVSRMMTEFLVLSANQSSYSRDVINNVRGGGKFVQIIQREETWCINRKWNPFFITGSIHRQFFGVVWFIVKKSRIWRQITGSRTLDPRVRWRPFLYSQFYRLRFPSVL